MSGTTELYSACALITEHSSGAAGRAQDVSSVPSHWVGELLWSELESLRAQSEQPAEVVQTSEFQYSSAACTQADVVSASQTSVEAVQTRELQSSLSVADYSERAATQIASGAVQISEVSPSTATVRVELSSVART